MDSATGKDFFNELVSTVTAFLARGLKHVFGEGIYHSAFGNICWADLIVAVIPVLIVILLNLVLRIPSICANIFSGTSAVRFIWACGLAGFISAWHRCF